MKRPRYHITYGPGGPCLEPTDDADGSLLGPEEPEPEGDDDDSNDE